MGKISPVTAKYIIQANIEIDGVVERPDVVGAIFGQTEGLLGSDLELRELQKSGRIGRIEVNVETKAGKTTGKITIPSSLDKAETSIIAAALEVIQRIGPCNARLKVENIEDVRVSKRNFVIERAKELLKKMMEETIPDSQELSDEVAYSVRVMEIQEYGKERLPAGPNIDESDEIIIVEGRADVINLLKHGFKNAIAINGTNIPQTIIDLAKQKIVTLFVDGDRGGDLIIKELTSIADIDYVAKAPDGKEVEEITKKEIHKALRSRISGEQAKLEVKGKNIEKNKNNRFNTRERYANYDRRRFQQQPKRITDVEKAKFSSMLEDLIGTRGAYILDEKLNILGKVPITELIITIKSLGKGIYAVVLDGVVDRNLLQTAEHSGINYLVAMDSKIRGSSRVRILTSNEL